MKKNIFSSGSIILLIIFFSAGFFLFQSKPASAIADAALSGAGLAAPGGIPVKDIGASVLNFLKEMAQKSGSTIFNIILTRTINKYAYETATYLGSGSKGQEPLFFKKNFGDFLADVGNSALGQTLEIISRAPKTDKNGNKKLDSSIAGLGINLCAPDLDIIKNISLGIAGVNTPPDLEAGACNYSSLKEAWQGEYDAKIKFILKDGNFGKRLSQTLDPGNSDVAVAFSLFNFSYEKQAKDIGASQLTRLEQKGWKSLTGLISDKPKGPPGSAERELQMANELQAMKIGKYTGDVLVDAANIFLNQLAMTAFNKLMRTLGSDNSNSSSLASPYSSNGVGGVTEVNRVASKLLQAQFGEQADYDVLSQLTNCINESNPGPTDCVINQQFGQAIESQITIAEAIKLGLINANKRVGYNEQGDDLSYKDGYPYRSLIILRKYRVLPVGWEVAAQYIKANPEGTKIVTLQKLLECYDPADLIYTGYNETWCHGLIDPNWVLKLPKLYCGMKGYGSQIVNSQIVPSNTGFCAVKSDVDCSSRALTNDCSTDWQECTKDDDCTKNTDYQCNFTIAKDVSIVRDNNYCADEQSCIKENSNGSCSNYGYCTEEQRRWSFGQPDDNACESVNNTCQNFTSDAGVATAYLENTLDYSNCDINKVGCKKYATAVKTYTLGTNGGADKISWDPNGNHIYFNNKSSDCDASQESCHQFIRIADNLDTNLIADGSFEKSKCLRDSGSTLLPSNLKDNKLVKQANAQAAAEPCQLTTFSNSPRGGYLDNRWFIDVPNPGELQAGIVNDKASTGGQSLYVKSSTGGGGIWAGDTNTNSILPTGFRFEDDRFYTLSANIFVVNNNNPAKDKVGVSLGTQKAETTTTNAWQSVTVTYYRSPGAAATGFYIQGYDTTEFYIDDLKLSVGSTDTSYSDYLDNNLVYEKLLPSYLEASCYKAVGSNYELKDDAPAKCREFVRKCNAEEVGCREYTSNNTGIAVTAKVKPKDICPASCVGYDVFVAQPTYFSAIQSAYFIPSSARQCSSQSAGCTAFTNLDKLDQGGEATEYYSYLRTCIKPDVNSCGEFYTWEGSDESGYQLKVYSLKKNNSEPASTLSSTNEASLCNEEIFKKLPSDPGYNYDCREFYGRDGTVTYHLYTRTISCSDDCHPYRREATQNECTSGGGIWEAAQSRCLYYSVPGEGTSCSASEVGCREYTGNIANNVRIVNNKTYDFESETEPTDGWDGGVSSSTSLQLGKHSLLGTNISKLVGKYDMSITPATLGVKKDESYTISFLAKSQAGSGVDIQGIDLINAKSPNPDSAAFITSGTRVGAEWKLYTFNLDKLNHEVSPIIEANGGRDITGEKIRINFSGPVYIDNISLNEIPDRYFLIKDSWSTPEECDQTVTGAYSPRYMLGCSQYQDSASATINLHSFSSLCQDSAAGCEQMIDTQNSNDYKASNNGAAVAADSIINVVYDPNKQCNQENKGCQRLGLATTYNTITTYSDIYKNNDPDSYETTSCTAAAVGCSQWSDGNGGTTYFKDPGNMACEWRQRVGSKTGEYEWLKKSVKTCNGDAAKNLCSTDSDCDAGVSCKLISDEDCITSYDKTIGIGGIGNRTSQPATWAGICNNTQAGCTEYIDPTSKFNENIISNPSYLKSGEYWTNVGASEAKQSVTISPQTVYIIKGMGDDGSAKVKINCPKVGTDDRLRVLDSSNNFSVLIDSNTNQPKYETDYIAGTTGSNGSKNESLEFYYQSTNPVSVQCTVTRNNRTDGQPVYLRQAIVSYQLAQNLDKTSANGVVKFDSGQILFNERAQSGSNKKALVYNADTTFDTSVDGNTPDSISTPKNANVILKVKADRSCAKWLSCLTYIPDPNDSNKKICLDVGLCDKMGDGGVCANFVDNIPKQNQQQGKIANLSGYSKVGYVDSAKGSLTLNDYYNIASMTQVGDTVSIANGNFEAGGDWVDSSNKAATILTQPDQIDALSLAPIKSVQDKSLQTSNYLVPEGKGILKMAAGTTFSQASSINLSLNSNYVLTFYAYNKGDGFKVSFVSTTPNGEGSFDLATFGADSTKNKWVKHSLGFKASATSYKIKFSNTSATAGEAYLDDLRIAPGLNNRCSDPANIESQLSKCNDPMSATKKPSYIGSSCRLYARENSLACNYIDAQNIRHKGVYGYCLEADPKNPATCLLWYPTNRIAGDQNEEMPPINFNGSNVSYCMDVKDECSATSSDTPQFYCNQFIKVSSDSYYWYQRMADGSNFKMPDSSSDKKCSIDGKSCTNDTECPNLPQTCVSNTACSITGLTPCPVTGNPPRTYCPDAAQTCVGKVKFPEDPLFFRPYSPTPTSVRAIDFGKKAGLNVVQPMPIESIKRNTSPGFFGAFTSAMDINSSKEILSPAFNKFFPYYGDNNSLGSRCTTLPNFQFSYGSPYTEAGRYPYEDYFNGTTGDGPSTNNPNMGSWDHCNIKYAAIGDLESGACNDGGCKPGSIKDVHNFIECNSGSCTVWDSSRNKTCSIGGDNVSGWTLNVNGNNLGDDGFCVGYCWNSTGKYSVAESFTKAQAALKRIFITKPNDNPWLLYELVGNNYSKVTAMNSVDKPVPCAGGVRPATVDPVGNTDYCYIDPVISNFTINGNKGLDENESIHSNSPYAVLSFNTKTDPEQLPIKSIDIYWGYKNSLGGDEITHLGPNLADANPRIITKRLEYYKIRPGNYPTVCNDDYCHLKIKIVITDNWKYSTEKYFGKTGTDTDFREVWVYKPQ
ncbi:MAG: DUF642 domain-containing protein [Candidatus Falkowbacteria bacterium]|nr:DUF642 domain-containing protein [Candidatus Falkowbacteria bacterium]